MAQLYNFSDLIEEYSVECELIRETGRGSYVGGNWVPQAALPAETAAGAVIPMTDRKIYQSGGMYTQNDREFITQKDIPLEPAAYIIFQGMKYHVESETDYNVYAGFHVYNLKWVGVFDRTEKD